MATRERPGDRAADDMRTQLLAIGREIRLHRRAAGLSIAAAARRAGISASRFGRLERAKVQSPGAESLARAARAVGLRPWFTVFETGEAVVDAGQLPVLARLESRLGPPLHMRRELALPHQGDLRSWDARISDGRHSASLDAEARLDDIQAVARRIGGKQRDDPDAGVALLVLNRTAHNRRVLQEHREALRSQFPLDSAAVLRELRAGRVPRAGGIVMV